MTGVLKRKSTKVVALHDRLTYSNNFCPDFEMVLSGLTLSMSLFAFHIILFISQQLSLSDSNFVQFSRSLSILNI